MMTVNSVTIQTSPRTGKTYGTLVADGRKYLVWSNHLDKIRNLKEGDQVEVTAKPTDDGKGMVLVDLKNGSATPGLAVKTATIAAPTPQSTGDRGARIEFQTMYKVASHMLATQAYLNHDDRATNVHELAMRLMFNFNKYFDKKEAGETDPQ